MCIFCKTEKPEKIRARTRELVAREMSLRDLRHAVNKIQETLARTLNMGQDGVSRLEKRSDLLLSTLRNYVEAVGGNLTLVAQFPDKEPIAIGGAGETKRLNVALLRRGKEQKCGRVKVPSLQELRDEEKAAAMSRVFGKK
jgi:hypothetical protein